MFHRCLYVSVSLASNNLQLHDGVLSAPKMIVKLNEMSLIKIVVVSKSLIKNVCYSYVMIMLGELAIPSRRISSSQISFEPSSYQLVQISLKSFNASPKIEKGPQ